MNALLTLVAILGWFALSLQFYLILKNRVTSIPETIIRYFGFFTILTNILVAMCASFLLFKSNSSIGKFFIRDTTATAITVYITIVGIVYNFILRSLWSPQGPDRVADELLHTVIPLLFILTWFVCIPKAAVPWKNIFGWLLFPLLYLICILARGSFAGYYPYPFLDVTKLGYNNVFINCLGMLFAFLLVSILFVLIDRFIKKVPAIEGPSVKSSSH